MTFLAIYLVIAALDLSLMAFRNGQEAARMVLLQPGTKSTVNWVNTIYGSLFWFARYISLLGRRSTARESQYDAAINLGYPKTEAQKLLLK